MKHIINNENLFIFSQDSMTDDTAYHCPIQSHNHFEIYFITAGTCQYFIDNRSYYLEAGDIAMIPEGIIHNTVYHNTGHSRMLIHCARHFIPAAASPKSYLYRNPQITNEIYHIIENIQKEYTQPDRLSADAIQCYMNLLFFLMARYPNVYPPEEEGSAYITKAVAYLQQHFTEDVSLQETARQIRISPEHFSRMFKKETGLGFCEYLNLLRLQKAEFLLKQFRSKSITEIAAACGFTDSNYFSVKFKKMYNMSPKDFRKGY